MLDAAYAEAQSRGWHLLVTNERMNFSSTPHRVFVFVDYTPDHRPVALRACGTGTTVAEALADVLPHVRKDARPGYHPATY